jgi:hypothetical protein
MFYAEFEDPMSEPRATTRERSIVMESTPIPAGSERLSRTRRIAALLAIVWTLPAILCAVHVFAHVLDHDPHELATINDQLTSGANRVDHHHGHGHPEPDPLVSPERTKELDVAVLVSVIFPVLPTRSTLECCAPNVRGKAPGIAFAVSGPRAPPIS